MTKTGDNGGEKVTHTINGHPLLQGVCVRVTVWSWRQRQDDPTGASSDCACMLLEQRWANTWPRDWFIMVLLVLTEALLTCHPFRRLRPR